MLVVPAFLVLAATLEGFWLERRDGTYDWKAYFTSIGDLALRMASNLLPVAIAAGALQELWNHRLNTLPLDEGWTWVVLFFGQELCYYWMHRADHRVRWLWATHSVHHSPHTLNLSAAYRLGWTTRLSIASIFFAPAATGTAGMDSTPRPIIACIMRATPNTSMRISEAC
jgi:sterol desaturase/sphingolipid hydroxylase (fatty acid hydroxylase superfamily)